MLNPVDSELKYLFGRALELVDRDQRAAFLDDACAADFDLRQQVEALLQVYEQVGTFLESIPGPAADVVYAPDLLLNPPTTASMADPGVAHQAGTWVGSYKLLQKIGEGGMGVVFMAEQARPIRRKVALKVIKPGMDTRQVIARFEAERQALAIMDHPNIARVLDGGATSTDRPFFVMELVRGVPITIYSDRNHLTTRERLELFLPVCRAIQHAHQKGIIHRDIKPSNVLVTLHDGIPVPKVIDFGVAKAIEQRLTERTMFTEFGAVLGTLEYMSPEQAELGALDIDTRSDVYSLGVLLYELLTGSTPLERCKHRTATYSEILRRVRDEDPPRPSTRLSHSNTALASLSAQRKTEPAQLSRLVRGELDWIVMKALEKDRTRRYESAISFARDVQRHLDGDVVEASPPTTLYKLRKLARKYRGPLVTISAFGALLMVALVVSVSLAIYANSERIRATHAEALARELQVRAQEGEQTAIDAVKRYGEVVRDRPELKLDPALASLRRTLLSEPYNFFQTLNRRLQSSTTSCPESLARLATASFELAMLSSETGQKEGSLGAFVQARSIWHRLVKSDGKRQYMADLARADYEIGFKQADRGESAQALIHFEEARAILEELLRADPAAKPLQAELGQIYHNIGNLEKRRQGFQAAKTHFQLALPIWDDLIKADPASTRYLGDLTWALVNIGEIDHDPSRLNEALEAYRKARPLREKLALDHPKSVWYQLDLASNHYNMANLQLTMNRRSDALLTFQEVCPMWQQLIALDPSSHRYRDDFGRTKLIIGSLLFEAGRSAEAAVAFDEAFTIWKLLIADSAAKPDPNYTSGQAESRRGAAHIDEQVGDLDAAQLKLELGINFIQRNLAANPEHQGSVRSLRDHLTDLVRVARQRNHLEEAGTAQNQLDALNRQHKLP